MKSGILPLFLCAALAAGDVAAQQQRNPAAQRPPATAAKPAQPAPPPVAPDPPAPTYEPQIVRLSEILGALTYLTDLCRPDGRPSASEAEGDAWRKRMRDLIEAEAQSPAQKERFAGAFNRGFADYKITYRVCTPAGKAAIEGLLRDGARTAHDLSNRFGS